MKKEFEEQYHALERKHWWFNSRRKCVLDILSKSSRNSKVLDIGCSSGILLDDLREKGFSTENIYGVDISPNAIENCRKIGLKNTFVMDAQNIQLDNQKFDILIASDCLEHLQDDEKALKNWYSLLKPGGKLIVFVPAFMFLWSHHDDINHHYRRYTKPELKEKLTKAGFKVKESGYWNFSLFLPVALVRMLTKNVKKDVQNDTGDLQLPQGFMNKLLYQLLIVENKLMRKVRFPFGVSTYCIAEKS